MSGTELQRRLAEACWTLPVIAMSGAHDPVVEMDAMRMGARAFLRKPFDAKALRDALDRAASYRS
jgi:FixJ family two-component response regulator